MVGTGTRAQSEVHRSKVSECVNQSQVMHSHTPHHATSLHIIVATVQYVPESLVDGMIVRFHNPESLPYILRAEPTELPYDTKYYRADGA
jgi:hypothetical protein